MEPTVSIIVPVYNGEKYIRRCVDSILHQEYTDYELLLTDDGSTDSSGKICDEYTAMDSRVRVFHKPNTAFQTPEIMPWTGPGARICSL